MDRPTVLIFIRHYLPGYKAGGPIRTVANMVEQLGDKLKFLILTCDRDASDTTAYPGVALDAWNSVGKARVFYASPRRQSLSGFARLMHETAHDVVYLNSFFDPVFTLLPLLARALRSEHRRPVVIAPRGEFSEGALGLKRWKKLPYLCLLGVLGLNRDLTWQASSEYEAEDIRRAIGQRAERVWIAPNIAMSIRPGSDRVSSMSVPSGLLRLVFLSRICPTKNLHFALRVLQQVKVPVVLNIYGVIDQEAYWQRCCSLIGALPVHATVAFHGAIPHECVSVELSKHDLFFLPSYGENYGHVIYEALASGLPVLISDRTPWRNLKEAGVGWDLPLARPEAFIAAIEAQALLGKEERAAQSRRAKEYAARTASDTQAVIRNLRLFTQLVNEQTVKKCV